MDTGGAVAGWCKVHVNALSPSSHVQQPDPKGAGELLPASLLDVDNLVAIVLAFGMSFARRTRSSRSW